MAKRKRFLWTTQAIRQLRELAAQGLTPRQISDIMGLSRNAIIGKQQREGIASPLKRLFDARAGSERPVDPAAALPITKRSGVGAAMSALKPNHCRWPINGVEDPDFHYCSAPRASMTKPYCAKHEATALSASAAAKALTHTQALTAL